MKRLHTYYRLKVILISKTGTELKNFFKKFHQLMAGREVKKLV